MREKCQSLEEGNPSPERVIFVSRSIKINIIPYVISNLSTLLRGTGLVLLVIVEPVRCLVPVSSLFVIGTESAERKGYGSNDYKDR